MAKTKGKIASKVLSVIMVMALLFVASGTIFISASAESLGTTIYLKTDDTSTPYLHYWGDAGESTWPGVAMTKVSGETNVYSYELPYDISGLTGVIFLSDGNGSKMTGDVTGITGNLYTLKGGNGTWSMYDTSSIKITSFGGDLESPQYIGASVTLSVEAEGGDGNLQYKISVSGAENKVLSDYSSKNSVVWTPTVEGDYTVLFEVKDGSGETNSRQCEYTIQDPTNAESPVFLNASPANNSDIQKGGSTTVTVNGAGGKINTNLLFYKTEVLDPDGERVNTVYYQLGNRVTFTADKLGTYTVNMYIQNSDKKNTTIMATYTYTSVDEFISSDTDTDETVAVTGVTLDKKTAELKVGESATLKATVNPSDATDKSVTWSSSDEKVATVTNGTVKAVAAGTATITVTTKDGGFTATCEVTVKADETDTEDTDTEITDTDNTDTDDTDTDDTDTDDTDTDDTDTDDTDTDVEDYVLGDIDGDGKLSLKDASLAQQAKAGLITLTAEQIKRGDVNGDGNISMKDASLIQQAKAGIITLGK